ncbi:MAG TPA: hypothetical protein VGI55_17925 [Solirubrobacteraceae bacterium]
MLRMGFGRTRILAVFTAALAGGFGTAALVGLSASEAVTPAQNITGNQTLVAGQALESPGGQYLLELASNGNLEEIYNGGGPVLWTTANGAPGDHAVLQPNGNLVVASSAGQTLWSSNSSGVGCPALDLQRDGNVVIYDTKAVYSTAAIHSISHGEKLESGWLLFASGGEYYLDMLSTGDLTLRNDANQLLWHTNTKGTGNYAVMQSDGNLVVYSAANKPLWTSNTAGNTGATLDMQSDGNLVIYSTAGKALWASNTHGAANNGKSADTPGPAASATPCPAPPPPAPPPVPTVTQTVTSVVTTTTATVETVPVPVRPHHVKVKVTVKWRYRGPVTRMERLTVGRMPKHAKFTAFYTQKQGHHRRHMREASTKHEVESMIRWLESYRYRPGDRLSIKISRHGYLAERAQFTIRDGMLPKLSR